MKVDSFEATYSPSCATFALHRSILDNKAKFPECIIQRAREQFYVEDLLASVDALEEAKLMYSQLKNIVRLDGFNQTEWASSTFDVMEPTPERETQTCLSMERNKRALGVKCNVWKDTICFRVRESEATPTSSVIL